MIRWSSRLGGVGGVTFGFNVQNTDQGMKGSGVIIDHSLGTKLQ